MNENCIIYDGLIFEDSSKNFHLHPLDNIITFDSSSYVVKDETFIPISEKACPNIVKDRYLISDKGNVYDIQKHEFCNKQNARYNFVQISVEKYKRNSLSKQIHRLELMSFNYINGCEKLEVNHKDLNKKNNNLENLEWVTRIENAHHAIKNNAISNIRDIDEVREIIRLYNDEK